MLLCNLCIKSNGFLVDSILDQLIDSLKGSTTDKQDIGGIDLDQFLMRVFSSSLRRY